MRALMKKWWILLGMGILAAVLMTGPLWLFPHQNYYRGRPSYYWRREVKQYADRSGWSAPYADRLLSLLGLKGGTSMPAVLERDQAAVPILIDLLQDDD